MSTAPEELVVPSGEVTSSLDHTLQLKNAYGTLVGTVEHTLSRYDSQVGGAYPAIFGLCGEVYSYLEGLSPDYVACRDVQDNMEAVRSATYPDLSGNSSRYERIFQLKANSIAEYDIEGRPIGLSSSVYYEGRTSGSGSSVIDINPEHAKTIGDIIASVCGITSEEAERVGAGYFLVAVHEISHMLHDFSTIGVYLKQYPNWALSDNLIRAIRIEKERFATGVESELLARFLADYCGVDIVDVETRFRRHRLLSMSPEKCFKEWQGIGEDNIGYNFPLTDDQIKQRLEAMDYINKRGVSRSLRGEFSMDRSEGSEFSLASISMQQITRPGNLVEY